MTLPITRIRITGFMEDGEIPSYLFGNFMEQLGYSSDGGALAQALGNPTLERESHLREEQVEYYMRTGKILTQFYQQGCDPKAIPDGFLLCRDSSGFGVAALDNFENQGIPFPWAPLGEEGKLTKAVGRIGGGVRLHATRGFTPASRGEMVVLDDGPAGIRQGVFLPFQRCLDYHGHAWVRIFSTNANSSGRIEVGFRRRLRNQNNSCPAGECLSVQTLSIQGSEWIKVEFHLNLFKEQVSQSEPVDWYLRWLPDVEEDLILDRVLLLPDDAIDDIFDPDVIRLCREYKPTLLRWPGGNFVSYYHWRDGIGPLDRRPTRRNYAWDGLETNFFGTDEFIRFCALVGAEPHITINSGTASPEDAAAWVEYCNGDADTKLGSLRAKNGHNQPYQVNIWEVGNEIHGSWQGGYYGADENVDRFLEISEAMRSVDPDIRLIATGNQFDLANPGPRFDFTNSDQRWNISLFEKASQGMDFLSLHSLPGNSSFGKKVSHEEAYYSLMTQPIFWERTFLPQLHKMAMTHPNRLGEPAKMAITEWGILGPLENRPEVRNYGAVPYAGVFLNSMIRISDIVEIAEATALLHGGAVHKAGGLVWYDPQCLVIRKYAELAGAKRFKLIEDGPCYDAPNAPDLSMPIERVPFVDVIAANLVGLNSGSVICLVNISLDQAAPVEIIVEAQNLSNIRWEYITWPDITAIAKPGNDNRFQMIQGLPEKSGSTIQMNLPICSVNWLYYQYA